MKGKLNLSSSVTGEKMSKLSVESLIDEPINFSPCGKLCVRIEQIV
jgi:hypothetical protein